MTERLHFHFLLSCSGKDWCWSWNSSTLATSCEELTHWKRPWCWEWLKMGGEGDDRGWDGWMASPTKWAWVWVNSGNLWWTGRPGALRFMGSQRVGHDWATELNWTELNWMWPDAMILVFQFLSFKPGFSLPSFTLIKTFFSSSSLSPINIVYIPCRMYPAETPEMIFT